MNQEYWLSIICALGALFLATLAFANGSMLLVIGWSLMGIGWSGFALTHA